MKIHCACILFVCFFALSGFSGEEIPGELKGRDREELLDGAREVVGKSKKLREEIAQEKENKGNYRDVASFKEKSEDEKWQKEVEAILSEEE